MEVPATFILTSVESTTLAPAFVPGIDREIRVRGRALHTPGSELSTVRS